MVMRKSDSRNFGEKVELESIADSSGQITVIEGRSHAGFLVRRVYFLHSLVKGAERGGHAHRALSQLIVPINGRFTIELERFGEKKVVEANDPTVGIFLPPLTWRELYDFSDGTVGLVLASEEFSEADYIRDRAEFDTISNEVASEKT